MIERSAIVTFTAAQMYALVNDVARYPEFLPWCSGAWVKEIGESVRLASIKVSRGILRTEFTTRNTLQPDTQIVMQLIDGPFRKLAGEWNFEVIDGRRSSDERGSRVRFRVEFEFNNRIAAAAFNAIFQQLCGSIVDSFTLRASKIYAS